MLNLVHILIIILLINIKLLLLFSQFNHFFVSVLEHAEFFSKKKKMLSYSLMEGQYNILY